jgi:hypothetical protein
MSSGEIMTDDEQGAGKRPGRLPAVSDSTAKRRLSDHHHQIALAIARGERWGAISRETGVAMNHIQSLHGQEQFRQLVDVYRDKLAQGDVDLLKLEESRQVRRQRGANLQLALEEQQWRLLNQPETFSHRDLQELIADHSDRLDMGKISKHLHAHAELADNLAIARQRRLQLSASVNSQSDAEESVPVDHSGNGKLQ